MSEIINEQITDVSVEHLIPYPKHPFKTLSGKEFDGMCASISQIGIIDPIAIRRTKKTDESGNELYEIISGHSRVEAAKQIEMLKIPARIMDLTDEEADIKVVDSNCGRRNIVPCELGKAFKLRLDASNRQGKRPSDSTSDQNEQKSSRDEVAHMFGTSGSKVHRYTRLTFLIPELQDAVDSKEILLSIGENISYLKEDEQRILLQILQKDKRKITRQQSIALSNARQEAGKDNPKSSLTKKKILEILDSNEDAPISKNKRPKSIKISYEAIEKHIEKHFEGRELTEEAIHDIILKALENYETTQ